MQLCNFTRLTILASISQRKKKKGSLNAYFLHYIINEKHSVKKEMLGSFSFTPSLFSCLVSLLSQLHWLISQFTSLSVISIHKNREMPQDASLKESNFLKNYSIYVHRASIQRRVRSNEESRNLYFTRCSMW